MEKSKKNIKKILAKYIAHQAGMTGELNNTFYIE